MVEDEQPAVSRTGMKWTKKKKDDQDGEESRENVLATIQKLKADLETAGEQCSGNIRAAAFAGLHMTPGTDHLMVCFDNGAFLGSRNPYAILCRHDSGCRYTFVTIGQPGNTRARDTVCELSYSEFMRLAQQEGHSEKNLVPVEPPPKISSPDTIKNRIKAALGTHCIMANSEDFCYWAFTGLRKGFFTTGDFLELVI
ncbi:MAG TPA: hypothetical protein PLP29_06955 [Candidatus Ozemobacteraceae bacterium]|nr:hypothetical protein [Candidatus Ozemobacteraceae bacterium]